MKETRSRGRPRTFDPDAVLDVATNEFLRCGFEGVSISELTASLGCTAPTLYSLFGSKEGLFRQALERYRTTGFAAAEALLTSDRPLFARLQTWLRATAASVTSESHARGCLILTGGLAAGASGAEAATALKEARAVALGALVAQFAQARESGVLPKTTDVEGLARFYLAVLQGLSAQAIDGATEEELQPMIALALAAWPGEGRDQDSPSGPRM